MRVVTITAISLFIKITDIHLWDVSSSSTGRWDHGTKMLPIGRKDLSFIINKVHGRNVGVNKFALNASYVYNIYICIYSSNSIGINPYLIMERIFVGDGTGEIDF